MASGGIVVVVRSAGAEGRTGGRGYMRDAAGMADARMQVQIRGGLDGLSNQVRRTSPFESLRGNLTECSAPKAEPCSLAIPLAPPAPPITGCSWPHTLILPCHTNHPQSSPSPPSLVNCCRRLLLS